MAQMERQLQNTPIKSSNTILPEDQLTPVRFLDGNPATGKSPTVAAASNATTCKSRLDVITKSLLSDYAKWQLAHNRGLSLCQSIEALKTRGIETQKEPTDTDATTAATASAAYPAELKAYCDKLAIITGIFSDITANAAESLRQLRALNKLPASRQEIFYRSWPFEQFVLFATEVHTCYATEKPIKEWVMTYLPHCETRAQLIRCSSAWEYAQHVDSWLALTFATLAEELRTKGA